MWCSFAILLSIKCCVMWDELTMKCARLHCTVSATDRRCP